MLQCDAINKAACKIAKSISKEKGTITAGGLAMTDVYQTTRDKAKTQAELRTAIKELIDSDIDMLICEVIFNYVESRNLDFISIILSLVFQEHRRNGVGY